MLTIQSAIVAPHGPAPPGGLRLNDPIVFQPRRGGQWCRSAAGAALPGSSAPPKSAESIQPQVRVRCLQRRLFVREHVLEQLMGDIWSDAPARVPRNERPTPSQIATTRAVVEWYLARYHRTADDPGVAAMFLDRERVGAFAIDSEALQRGDDSVLFRMLVATAMFQRRQDVQILRILRRMPAEDVAEVTDAASLLRLVDQSRCERMKSNDTLISRCNLTKHPRTRLGCCAFAPRLACHLKRHTVVLKRYGHFGKVPTSAALALREAGVSGLGGLYRDVLRSSGSPFHRARELERRLSAIWRVSTKIACMFLSAVTNPDLAAGRPPWEQGVDWTHFVVVDSNVDAFLASVGYRGRGTYEARRAMVQRIARRIDLRELDGRLHSYNPRVVQQAMYLFMSATNRRALARDCSHEGPTACAKCPRPVRFRCVLDRTQGKPNRA